MYDIKENQFKTCAPQWKINLNVTDIKNLRVEIVYRVTCLVHIKIGPDSIQSYSQDSNSSSLDES